MLLDIYLGTTALSWATVFLTSIAVQKKLKREGYVFVEENKSLEEKILSYVSAIFTVSIPVYNIINAIFILGMGEKFYGIMENKLLEKGKIIYRPNEYETNDIIESDACTIDDTKTYSEESKKVEKNYIEMTPEEKIAFLEQIKQNISKNGIEAYRVYRRKR